ncbi:chorismate lyase [Vibrio algicola]|uniref:Probable chorismate pyruvate-lyase n=1 Tax=Vibrio algicola TaxID=2662262 RepID=A0A5Q0TFA5_9VIBR|nr:chorismate lyase [Vibrio algicola]
MKADYADYFKIINDISWQSADVFDFSSCLEPSWLLELGSLSRLFSQHCQSLSADVIQNTQIDASQLTDFQREMLGNEACLLREVILAADEQPWLLGSTLIPLSSLSDAQFDLAKQGSKPLGLTVFQAEQVKRNGLHLATKATDLGLLAARSSRLWMNDKPMLVTELFLPASPIYRKDSLK